MTTATHQVALSAGGSVNRPPSRYANDPRVAPKGDGYTVHTLNGIYEIRPDQDGWGIYAADGGCAMAGIRRADDAIGALIGDAHA